MTHYNCVLENILSKYTDLELKQICKTLNKTYNLYDSEEKLWNNLKFVLGNTTSEELSYLRTEVVANKVINDLIFRYYHCERVLKYYFMKNLLKLKNNIVAFEMNVGDSRVDICRINGHSYAYEIKTEYDVFERLDTQIADYSQVFDKVYLIVHKNMEKEALKHIPDHCGLITYRAEKDEVKFKYARKAICNNVDGNYLVKSLSSADSAMLLKLIGEKKIPTLKSERMELIYNKYNEQQLKIAYRKLLKSKYQIRWRFVSENFEKIIPIDIQSFFSSNLSPKLAYHK
ncbi:sce7726 family protein [Pelosinus propionicus]|nr:sce7726 family protein [Pelosinus propionicus]